ncbi:MAG: hypothetical protein RIR62_151 [Pseudomonadota bacterium]|jgi:polyisoprenoid-binding protein YceI
MRHWPALLIAATLATAPALAAPHPYRLQAEASSVGFETDFGPDLITGTMPVASADLVIDFDSLANCRIDVALDVAHAQASFPFAAQAMKGPKVLDADRHPEIAFRSTAVRPKGAGAEVTGEVTIRGVTRPMVLEAVIWRQKGTVEGDRSRLTVRLTGTVRRSDFGATGWADMVGDDVRLTIIARIAQAD